MGMGGETKQGTAMEQLTAFAASLLSIKLQSPSTDKRRIINLLRGVAIIAIRSLLRLLFILLSPLLPPPPCPPPSSSSAAADTPAARALSHVLAAVSRVPVASRKYDLVRSLADRLLDDNLRFCGDLDRLNRAALADAFASTLHRLEAAVSASASASAGGDGSFAGVVRSGMRMLSSATSEEGEDAASAGKMAAEALWLAERMAECGAAWEAVARWGAAAGLARLATSAEPRLQAALVRVSVFLFKQANVKQFGKGNDEEESEDTKCAATHHQMAMLMSWLPLLCQASNGTDAPILSSVERLEMVRVLEDMIQKLSWEQQEVILALWLHHFTSSPNSDWPNLESCYTRWYARSLKLLSKE